MVTEMAATAMKLLGVRAATSVASAIAAMPADSRKLAAVDGGHAARRQPVAIQPPAMLPTTPNR